MGAANQAAAVARGDEYACASTYVGQASGSERVAHADTTQLKGGGPSKMGGRSAAMKGWGHGLV